MYINPLNVTEDLADLEIFVDGDPKKESTGLVLHVRPNSHPEVKKFSNAQRRSIKAAKKEGSEIDEYLIDNIEDIEEARTKAHIEGWHWKEGVDEELSSIEYSKKQLDEFLKAVPFGRWIKKQVLEIKDKDENFYKGLAKD